MEKQKNIPQLRFPEFEGEWGKKKIGEIGSIQMCRRIFTHQTTESGDVPFYKIGTLGSLPDAYISKDLFNEYKSKYNYPLKGHTLITCSGTIGKCVQFDGHDSYYQDSNIIWIDNNDVAVFDDFLFLLLSNYKWGKLNSTTITRIYTNDLKVLQFYFPTLPEQQKISSFFTAVDHKIIDLKRKNNLLEQYKKGVMQKILSQQIRFKDGNGQEFPKWDKKKLGDVLIEHKTVNSESKFNEVFSVAKHKGVINQIEHLGRSFSAKDISNYKVINPGDIVYTKSPTSDFPFGIIKQNLLNRSGVVSPLYGVFKPKTNALGFLLHNYFLSWINTYNYLNPLVQKGAKNTMNINNDDFLNGARLHLPVSEVEQIKIANFLLAIDEKINHTKKQVEKAEVWKKGLMQQMFV